MIKPNLHIVDPTRHGLVDLSDLPTPPIGGKAFLIQEKGLFLFQRGPGTLRTLAITHAGSGSIVAYDGLPDEDGVFQDDDKKARAIYKANPVVMGSWMLDAGFINGLTISVKGGIDAAPAFATIVWYPFTQRGK